MKAWYQSKTVWTMVLAVVIAVGEFVAQFVANGDYSVPAIILGVVGIAGIVLRFLTSEPIG